ncbi:CPBP family glutamic-type intramembrane protease [Rheinheimera muenzenbergensis]|uniref:CPBP family glutamic-type intramembrane protease n=1 Tax=Rheinheimera muenzenbergensis TaxID=1193628 RepID=A0ABU8C4F3_9GAMM
MSFGILPNGRMDFRFFVIVKYIVNRQQGWLVSSLKSATLTLSVAIPLAIMLGSLFPGAQTFDVNPLNDWFFLVFFGPLVETFILTGIMLLLKLVSKDPMTKCLISVVIWAVIHGVSFPIQGVVNFFNFLMFSIVFLVWQEKSFWTGFNMTLLVHVLHNSGVFVVVMASESFF